VCGSPPTSAPSSRLGRRRRRRCAPPSPWPKPVPDPDEALSALVILRPADPSAAGEPVTSANLARHAPASGAVDSAMQYFTGRGFEVGTFVGTSFSIAAPAPAFRAVFGRSLPTGARGDLEFDLRALPTNVRRHVQAVSFSEPLEFGPGGP